MSLQPLQTSTPPNGSQPRLSGVGQSVVSPDVLDRRRFCITVDSVHYYLESGRVCCAVLLTTTFLLGKGEKLAFANIPLIATKTSTGTVSNNPGGDAHVVEISDHYPPGDEFVEVAHVAGTKDILATPAVNVNALGTGVGVSGMGINRHRQEHKPYFISLHPVKKVIDNYPTSLSWKFEDLKGIFYPQSTKLLVIVTKSSDTNELWFPFELRLEWTLKVEIHGLLPYIVRLVARPDRHDGWCFQIGGKYREGLAKTALEDAKRADETGTVPTSVGLRAAAKQWIAAQTHVPSAPTAPVPSAPAPP